MGPRGRKGGERAREEGRRRRVGYRSRNPGAERDKKNERTRLKLPSAIMRWILKLSPPPKKKKGQDKYRREWIMMLGGEVGGQGGQEGVINLTRTRFKAQRRHICAWISGAPWFNMKQGGRGAEYMAQVSSADGWTSPIGPYLPRYGVEVFLRHLGEQRGTQQQSSYRWPVKVVTIKWCSARVFYSATSVQTVTFRSEHSRIET